MENDEHKTKSVMVIKRRRLQFQGGSCYVALPLNWIETHGLETNKTVQITLDSDSRLIIEPMKD